MSYSFVVDNSIVMSWCFADEKNDYADDTLNKLKHNSAIVPAIWQLEVINVLLVAKRQQRITQSDTAHFLALLNRLPITVEPVIYDSTMEKILAIGRSHQLSSYDSAYLELAMRHGIPIATLDSRLSIAAQTVAVPLLE